MVGLHVQARPVVRPEFVHPAEKILRDLGEEPDTEDDLLKQPLAATDPTLGADGQQAGRGVDAEPEDATPSAGNNALPQVNGHAVGRNGSQRLVSWDDGGIDLRAYLGDLEQRIIQEALAEADGVVAQAAKLLHLRRTTLVEKLRKDDIQRPDG